MEYEELLEHCDSKLNIKPDRILTLRNDYAGGSRLENRIVSVTTPSSRLDDSQYFYVYMEGGGSEENCNDIPITVWLRVQPEQLEEQTKLGKKIVIENCSVCLHRDHLGGFGNISYVPCCGKMKRKELPYTVSVNDKGGVHASSTGVIPSWCPLEDNES